MQKKQDVMATKQMEMIGRIEKEEVSIESEFPLHTFR
jgi:hypothetical protein